MKPITCKFCHQVNRHWSYQCKQRPKKLKPTYTVRKPIKSTGARGMRWIKFRKKWLQNHPPNHQGYYTCYICNGFVLAAEVTLDHIIPRSRRPDLVFDESNLAPAHLTCNYEKGSKTYS